MSLDPGEILISISGKIFCNNLTIFERSEVKPHGAGVHRHSIFTLSPSVFCSNGKTNECKAGVVLISQVDQQLSGTLFTASGLCSPVRQKDGDPRTGSLYISAQTFAILVIVLIIWIWL